jgi:chromosome segregation ATPase
MAEQQMLQVESVERIRDIIFGPKMRDYEQRFEAVMRDLDRLQQELDHLSEQLAAKDAAQSRAVQAVRQDMTKTGGEVRNELKAESARLSTQMNEQNTAQSSALQSAKHEHNQVTAELQTALKADIEQLNCVVADQEAAQKSSLQNLRQELRKADADLREELRKIAQRLTDEKTDRGALGDLFIELGQHVKSGGTLVDMLKSIDLPG